jgi:hypothetical protein
MRKWTKYIFGSIILLIVLYYFFYVEEGFQMKAMNVYYPSKEVFLIAPNIRGGDTPYVDIYQDTYPSPTSASTLTAYYESAYTLNEAQAACQAVGAQLATLGQLQTATALGATWCVASWTSDGEIYAPIQTLCPNTKTKGAAVTTVAGTLRKITTPQQKAYPVCWGTKPPEPTVTVRPFSKASYNMVSPTLLSSVMTGDSKELFPAAFTADQARYALEQNNYNIGAPSGTNPARQYLINNITKSGTSNPDTQIYRQTAGYSEDQAEGSNSACAILANTRQRFVTQFNALRTVFRDVSGAVMDMLGAKNQNSFYAAKLQDICAGETPQSSPSCFKLATLDYSVLYNTSGADAGTSKFTITDTSTSRLAKLEALNFFKFQREAELCTAYERIQTIETYIGCSAASSGAMGSQCAYKRVGSDGPLAHVMVGLDVNSGEFLKLRLQEIAPYLTSANYANLVSGILNKLSLTIRLPSLNDFNTANMNFEDMTKRIDAIGGYFANSGP